MPGYRTPAEMNNRSWIPYPQCTYQRKPTWSFNMFPALRTTAPLLQSTEGVQLPYTIAAAPQCTAATAAKAPEILQALVATVPPLQWAETLSRSTQLAKPQKTGRALSLSLSLTPSPLHHGERSLSTLWAYPRVCERRVHVDSGLPSLQQTRTKERNSE